MSSIYLNLDENTHFLCPLTNVNYWEKQRNCFLTFTGNDDFPYLLNLVTLNTETLCYQAFSRVLYDKQDGESHNLSFYEVFKQATKVNAKFNHGKSLRQIVVDFDDAEYNGLTLVLGKDITEKLLRGCSVHWKCSVNKVANLVCLSRDEETIFKTLAGKTEDASRKEDVMEIFDIVLGKFLTAGYLVFCEHIPAAVYQDRSQELTFD